MRTECRVGERGLTQPSYLTLHRQGILAERIAATQEILRECTVCPRLCRVNRFEGRAGTCRTNALPVVSSYNPHFGEEAPLVGRHG